ncbi:NADH dehydrogenase [ubiquinone] 1 beta subcomplex subunit 4 [Heterocephalus glaber]|uniref:NADH dehydrogenase [ubiquinone] 1 beta subcomplex subunit 4 n=1 Tax=Heterocephalus glaber TaxID=10181 RepID=G5AU90_HETGA|nr:NADH dehydrogenase [ubiquinone] 1 beta subcomplex subunit 4 [Heterocephalus glaber]EHB00601.1 NADH dehydrogenase [ubiquinone] 1 beta subcomplex subunit 4 [Heterocephalus glaber]
MAFPKYKPSRLAPLPPTLDPAEYDISPEARNAQVERLAIKARLKREYLLQFNDPNRRGLIEDPALTRWTYARSANIYPSFRPTPKNSLIGISFGLGPLIFWYYVFKMDRDRKEKLIQEGKLERPFNISY